MQDQWTDDDGFDAGADDPAPAHEIDEADYAEVGVGDTAVEVELLVARIQATRFWGA
jgi:hypothetical protein